MGSAAGEQPQPGWGELGRGSQQPLLGYSGYPRSCSPSQREESHHILSFSSERAHPMAGPRVPFPPCTAPGWDKNWHEGGCPKRGESIGSRRQAKPSLSRSRIYLHVKENSHPESREEEKANKPKGPSHLPPECKRLHSPVHLATSQGSRMPSLLLLRKEKPKA